MRTKHLFGPASEFMVRFRASKTCFSKPLSATVLLTDPSRPLCCLFVCVEVLRPSQPNGVMSSAVSLPNHTFTGPSVVVLCLWYYIWCLSGHCLFLVSHPFGVSVIIAFPVYLNFKVSLRKHAYLNILRILPPKNENFRKKSDIFHFSTQNMDCGNSLKPPRGGSSNAYHNLCFEQK